MLIASDLQTDFIVDCEVELDMALELLLDDLLGLFAGESSVYVFVLVLSITLGSPGEQRAFDVPASFEPFFMPVWAGDDAPATK